jgi:hypothetical protein
MGGAESLSGPKLRILAGKSWTKAPRASSISLANIKALHAVESLVRLLHNPPAFTSPVDEVVAWGEDTWP